MLKIWNNENKGTRDDCTPHFIITVQNVAKKGLA